jgi:F0F1-type ATP synthase assembly protein I
MSTERRQKPRSEQPSLMRHAGMGFELTAVVLGFAAIGYWVDRSFETFPRGTAIGAVLGIIGGMYNFLREALQLTREQVSKTPESKTESRTGQPDADESDDTHL